MAEKKAVGTEGIDGAGGELLCMRSDCNDIPVYSQTEIQLRIFQEYQSMFNNK